MKANFLKADGVVHRTTHFRFDGDLSMLISNITTDSDGNFLCGSLQVMLSQCDVADFAMCKILSDFVDSIELERLVILLTEHYPDLDAFKKMLRENGFK